jgi:hypothetical protein
MFIAACGGAHGHDRQFRAWLIDEGGIIEIIVFVLVSFIAGVWLRTAFGHWRWPRPFGAWILLIAGLSWIKTLIWPLTWIFLKATHQPAIYDGPRLQESMDLAFVLGLSFAISLTGVGLGRVLLRLTAGSRRKQFLKKLARMRKRRHAE